MAIPYVAGQNTFTSGSSSYSLSITAAVAAADGLVLCGAIGGTAPPAITSVTDTATGSSWSQLQETTASPYVAAWQRTSATALTTSDTITVNFATAATGGFALAAVGFTGQSSLDLSVTPTTGSSTAPSVTGTPVKSGEEALAVFSWANGCGTGTIGGTGTQLTQQHAGASGSFQTVAYVTSPASGSPLTVSYTVTSGSWRATLISFATGNVSATAALAGAGTATTATSVLPAALAGSGTATAFATVGPWYMSNASFINSMDASNHSVTLAAFGAASNYSINNTANSVTSLPAGYSTTPLLKYISYFQFKADVTGTSQTAPDGTAYTPTAGGISGSYTWLMYDTENWNPNPPSPYATAESQSEIDDPWTYMASFVTLAHAHGYKVILPPGRDLGSDATSVHPNTFGSLDAWYESAGGGIATAMANAGADIAHIQDQANQNTSEYATFFNNGLGQVHAVSTTIPVSAGVSTTSPVGITAAQMAASAQSITTPGYWLNTSTATISTAVAFLQAMVAAVNAAPNVNGTGAASAVPAVRTPGSAGGGGAATATPALRASAAPAGGGAAGAASAVRATSAPAPVAGTGAATATANVIITVTGQASGGGSARATVPLTVVQSATPVFLNSLTGPVTVTLATPTGSWGTSSLVACISDASNSSVNPHVTGITLGGSAGNWQSAITRDSSSNSTAAIWFDPQCAAGQTAVAVTFGGSSGSTGNLWVSLYEVTGVLAADRSTEAEAAATSFSSGATAAATQGREIFFGCANSATTTMTVTGAGSWTATSTGGGGLGCIHAAGFQSTISGGTATFSGTLSPSGGYTAVAATFYAGSLVTRWSGMIFNQIDVNSNGYTGRPLTSALQSAHADFPGGATPQTQQSLPCQFEPLTDYFQGGFPWPGMIGFMSPPWITGPAQTGLTDCVAALYLGSGVGSMTDVDPSGLPLNKKVVTTPSSTASLPAVAGSWAGAPLMAGGSTAIPAIPLIGWHLGDKALADIAAGVYDTGTIIPVAQQCKAWPADASGNPAYPGQPGGQVFIRLMHEFNLPNSSLYCPGAAGTQPPSTTTSTFIAAWQHIVQVFAAQGATNVRWVWCANVALSGTGTPNQAGFANTSGTCALMYPGDAYVDYIGIDGYNKGVTWATFSQIFLPTYTWITQGDAFTILPGASTAGPISNTKPVIICETSSYEDDMFTSPPQTKAQYIGDIIPTILASMPMVAGVHIWHDLTDALEWVATSTPATQSAWNTLTTTFTGRPALTAGVTAQLVSAPIAGAGTAVCTARVRVSGALAGTGVAVRRTVAAVDISAEPQATTYARVQPVTASQQVAAVGASKPAGAAASPTASTIQVGNVTQNRV